MVDRSKLPNAFAFVSVAGARARQLLKGAAPRVQEAGKPARIAQREVLAGEVQPVGEDSDAPASPGRQP